MSEDPHEHPKNSPAHFLPRKVELQAFAEMLPIKGTDSGSNRIFNVWGEPGVGKSTFISEFRESELISRSKILWMQPTREGALDSIPEFIRACSKTIRFPAKPDKEKKIAEQIESVQRGKTNPIVSDDSILITRSSIAKQKRPYINQAAASSVGRTEVVRDDAEINVGLGESQANNHAEAFLDSLPLQSLGTDLTIIYIESYQSLSVSITDWLRDYVFPAATRGAYRRSIVLLIESHDPLKLAYPNETWGEWSGLIQDFKLYPLSDDDIIGIGLGSGLQPETAHYLWHKSLGFPANAYRQIQELKTLDCLPGETFLDSLPKADQLKVAALSLPQTVNLDDIPVIFGNIEAENVFNWFRQLPGNQSTLSPKGRAIRLSDALRCAAINRFREHPHFARYQKNWAAMGRLEHSVPSRSDRDKLMLISGLLWIDEDICNQLFGDQAEKITAFVSDTPSYFNRLQNHYRISDRIRPNLQQAATQFGHAGMQAVFAKAKKLWEAKKQTLDAQIAAADHEINAAGEKLNELLRKQKEIQIQIRIHKKDTSTASAEKSDPSEFLNWLSFGLLKKDGDSTLANFKHIYSDLNRQAQEIEIRIDELRNEADARSDLLAYPFV